MDLFTEMLKEQQVNKPIRCPVGRALRELGDDASGLMKSLLDPTIDGTVISKVMTNKGYRMSDTAVQRHRRQICACEA